MTDVPVSIPLDLSRFSEASRRRLYDRVAEILFAPPSPPTFTPDQARLQVVYLFGRWFAAWLNLDELPTCPEHQRIQVVRIGVRPEDPADIVLHEV